MKFVKPLSLGLALGLVLIVSNVASAQCGDGCPAAPEIGLQAAGGAFALLSGAVMMIRGRKR